MTGEQLNKAFERAKNKSGNWRAMLEEALTLALPHLESFSSESKTKGAKRGTGVYDSTMMLALMQQAAQNQGGLVPPFQEWTGFDIEPSAKRMIGNDAKLKALRKKLDEQEQIFFEVIRNSNFDTEVHPAFLDCGISTGAIIAHEGDDERPVRFECAPLGSYHPVAGPWGTIETVHREIRKEPSEIKRLWPEAKWSTAMKEILDKDSAEEVCVRESCIYNPETGKTDYVVFEEKEAHVAYESSFEVSPWIPFRMFTAHGETMGRGPVLFMLADGKTLNKVKELELRNAALAVSGIFQFEDDGTINPASVSLIPGAMIPKAMGSKGLEPLETSADFRLSQIIVADLRSALREGLLNVQLPPLEGPTKTATEVAAQFENAQMRITPPMARLYWEFLIPLVRRVRHILIKRGIIEPLMYEDKLVRIVPVSPLAKIAAKQRALEVSQTIFGVMSVNPILAERVFKLDDWARWFAKQGNTPGELVRTVEEVTAYDQQAQQAKLAEIAAQAAGAEAGSAGK